MIFRPRIFISSTLKENLTIRKELDDFFRSVGAETMIYEKNLTPSTISMTYRQDILDADFVIFIIKNGYGALTDSGISGTHEEFNILTNTNIPKHVYIKLNADENKENLILKDIDKQQISFYYFKTDKDLLNRIKETTFTIAKDIMLRKVEQADLSPDTVKKIAVKYDYEKAIEIIKIVNSIFSIPAKMSFDIVYSNFFSTCFLPVQYDLCYKNWKFVDKKLEDILVEMLKIYDQYISTHGMDFTFTTDFPQNVDIPLLGAVSIHLASRTNFNSHTTDEHYRNLLGLFSAKFNEFVEYAKNMKMDLDILS